MIFLSFSFSLLSVFTNFMSALLWRFSILLTASIAQLVERPLSEREVVGSNPAAAPYQRCKKWY